MSWLLVFYILSGTVTFSLEILWFRLLTLSLGTTHIVTTGLLAGYMLGMSLGALLVGTFLTRKRSSSLPALAFSHLFLALSGFGIIGLIQVKFTSFFLHSQLHWITGMFMVIPSAMASGAIYPALAHLIQPGKDKNRNLAFLYGVNILGGVSGLTFLSLFGLPELGLRLSSIGTALLALFLSGTSILLLKMLPSKMDSPESLNSKGSLQIREKIARWMAVAFVLGFTGLGLEIAVIRILTPIMGLSLYAVVGTMVPFLVGLGIGGILAGKLVRIPSIKRTFALVAMAAGTAIAFALLMLPYIPGMMLWTGKLLSPDGINWGALLLVKFFLSAAIQLPGTILIGVLFPLTLALAAPERGPNSSEVGILTASNALGAVLGPVVVNMILIGTLGLFLTLKILVLIYPLVGLLSYGNRFNFTRLIFASAVIVMLIFSVPAPDPLTHHSGVYWAARLYESRLTNWKERFSLPTKDKRRVNTRIDGPTATVLVVQEGGMRFLIIDGKPASNTILDSSTQVALAQLPLQMDSEIKSVLVIGWGSGQTTTEVLKYPVDEVVTVEISREVISAAPWFREINAPALADERLSVIIDDARHYLNSTEKTFDLIISQPSNPWVGFSGNLFTREFFEICKDRLATGGMMVQWFQSYGADREDLQVFLRTFESVFDSWSLWSTVPGDLILTSTPGGPIAPREGVPSASFIATSSEVDLSPGPYNTDDRPILTYSMARRILDITALNREELIIKRED